VAGEAHACRAGASAVGAARPSAANTAVMARSRARGRSSRPTADRICPTSW
jgi:hypothetical protein